MLVDTNVILRTLQFPHPQQGVVDHAIGRLLSEGHTLCIVPPNLVELWVVATRPIEQNGLGLTPAQAALEVERLKGMFTLLPEVPAIFAAWEVLVTQYAVSGKPAHDARLVAAMQVHGETSILTFDKRGFERFPGIQVLSPADVGPLRDQ